MFDLYAWRNSTASKKFFLIFGSLILCHLVLMRYQVLNGFSILSGGGYDSDISAAILEHWFRFFQGSVSWTDVGYFFPYEKTIANTDAYFLNSLAYIPFRFLGLDVFISAELSNLVIKSVGFLSAYLLCRKVFSMGFFWSLLVAIVFTLSNGMTVHSSRIQLSTVAFFPLMALLLWSMASAFLAGNLGKFRRSGTAAGVFYGAWCLTDFYMAWFFLLYTTIFAIVIFLGAGNYRAIKGRLIAHFGSVFIVFGVAVASLVPFLYVFLPKSYETGVRPYHKALSLTVPLHGILQVGKENYVWGWLYNHFLTYVSPPYISHGEYDNTGFPIVLFALFLLGCIKALRSRKEIGVGAPNAIIWSGVITTIITWLLILNIKGHSLWFFVFYLFPGAKALRVVAAYQLFLALPVSIIAIKYLSSLRLRLTVIIFMCAFLIVEEFNKPPVGLDRAAELDRISLPFLPPKECRSFYVSGWNGQENLGRMDNLYAHNVTAMLIAQFAGIPTLNGFSSFMAPDARTFWYPNRSDYDHRVYLYAKRHRISNLCQLDLNSKRWAIIKDSDITHMHVPSLLMLAKRLKWMWGG